MKMVLTLTTVFKKQVPKEPRIVASCCSICKDKALLLLMYLRGHGECRGSCRSVAAPFSFQGRQVELLHGRLKFFLLFRLLMRQQKLQTAVI